MYKEYTKTTIEVEVNQKAFDELLVKDLMTKEPFSLLLDDCLESIEEIMKWQHIRHIPIVDESDKLIGIVTHRDLLKIAISSLAEVSAAEKKTISRSIKVRDIMNKKVTPASPNDSLKHVSELMFLYKYGCMPVVDADGKLVGILTEADFVKCFYKWDIRKWLVPPVVEHP
jgi:CBS domain-containing membrane protein